LTHFVTKPKGGGRHPAFPFSFPPLPLAFPSLPYPDVLISTTISIVVTEMLLNA